MDILPENKPQHVDSLRITVLKAANANGGRGVRKTLIQTVTGELSKLSSEPKITYWYRERHTVSRDIDALYEFITATAARVDCCLVTGEPCGGSPLEQPALRRKIAREGAPATLAEGAGAWLPVDIDHAAIDHPLDPLDPLASITPLVDAMGAPFNNCSYVWQLTASARPGAKEISVRLYFLTDRPITNDDRTGLASAYNQGIKFLDPAIYQAAQPIYTAPPEIRGGKDPFPQRIGVSYGELDAVPWSEVPTPPPPMSATTARENDSAEWRSSQSIDDCLAKIGDHAGGEGCHKPILQAVWRMVRENWKPARIKAVIRATVRDPATVWNLTRAPGYIEGKISDHTLNDSIRGAATAIKTERQQAARSTQTRTPGRAVSLEAAQGQLTARINEWLQGKRKRVVVLSVPPGTGKTFTAAKVLREYLENHPLENLVWAFPTHKQGEEVAALLGSIGVKIDARVPDREGAAPLCARPEIIRAIDAAMLSAHTAGIACENEKGKCQYLQEGECQYFKQFTQGHRVRLIPQTTLTLSQARAIDATFRALSVGLVIDESPIDALIHHKFFDLSEVVGGEVIAEIINKLIANDRPTDPELVEYWITRLEEEKKARCEPVQIMHGPGAADDWGLLQELKTLEGRYIPKIRPVYNAAVRWLNGDKNVFWMSQDGQRVHVAWCDELPEFKTVLILDATPDEAGYRAIFGDDVEFIRIEVKQNLEIIQASDKPIGKTSLLNPEGHTLAQVAALAVSQGAGLITNKAAVARARAEGWIDDTTPTAHFNALRGLNNMKDLDVLVVAGRPEPPALAIEARARALYPREDLTFTGQYINAMDNGIVVASHPDPRCDALLRAARESEIEQGIGRLRAVRSPTTKRVFLLTNTPLPYPVQHARFNDVVMPGALARYMLKMKGVAVMSPGFMADTMPELWGDQRAAENWIQRTLKYSLPLLNRFNKHFEYFKFRRYGQKRHSFVLSLHDLSHTREELERVLQAPIVEIKPDTTATPEQEQPGEIIITLNQMRGDAPRAPDLSKPPDIVLRCGTVATATPLIDELRDSINRGWRLDCTHTPEGRGIIKWTRQRE
jgi:hypothetical protein